MRTPRIVDFMVGGFQFLHVLRGHVTHPYFKSERNQAIHGGLIATWSSNIWMPINQRRSQGVHWVYVHPPGRKKILGPNLRGKVVSTTPGRERTPEAEPKCNF